MSNQDLLTRRGAAVGSSSSASSSRGSPIRRVQWYSDATSPGNALLYPWPVLLTTVIFAAVTMACITAGISQFVHHVQDSTRAFRASSAVILLAAGGAQLFLIGAIGSRNLSVINPRLLLTLLQWQFVALVGSYVFATWLTAGAELRYIVRAAMSAMWAVSLAAAAMPAIKRHSTRGRSPRLVRCVMASLIGLCTSLVAGELFFWSIDHFAGITPRGSIAVRESKLSPGTEYQGGKVNGLGYWDDEFQLNPTPGMVRIAAIGQAGPLSGTRATNCLGLIERRMPGMEVYNFGLRDTGPREFIAQFTGDVARYRPQLLLAFVSANEQLADASNSPALHDWRMLRTVQWTAHALQMSLSSEGHKPFTGANSQAIAYEGYLRKAAEEFTACRTPIDAGMKARWDRVTAELNRLVSTCKKHDVPLALVLVPSEFQVSASLRETLIRRVGCKPESVDVELPQRKLASFASARKVPVVDLLPHFRSATANPFAADHHGLSDSGSELAGQVLSGWLNSRYAQQVAGE